MGDYEPRELSPVHQQLFKYAEDLAETYRVEKTKTRELEEAYLDTVHRLALAAEYRDDDTGDHILRMSRYAAILAHLMGLPESQVQTVLYASSMHDVGKIGIPDVILLKPGRLTHQEFETMKNHTLIGGLILDNPRGEVLRQARIIALSHHERWDGGGYPYGLAGEQIPMAGRLTALADVFDALTSARPYKDPFSVERARDIICEERGTQFQPEIVDAFVRGFDRFVQIKTEIDGNPDLSLSDIEIGPLVQDLE